MNEEIQRIEKKCADELNRQKSEANDLIHQIRSELLDEINRLKNDVDQNKSMYDEKLNLEIRNRETADGLAEKEITGIKDELGGIKKIIEIKQKEVNELKKQKEEEENGIHLPHNQDFNGIIKYLTDKAGGNIHDKNVIEVSSNSFLPNDFPKNLLDFNCDNQYQADSKNDSWVCFDFKNKRVKIKGYSIKSYKSGSSCHLKSWILEISNDGQSWITIDEHENCSTLKGGGNVGTFDVKLNDFSRYVRLHQTDTPWGCHNLWFHYIEFYGYLQE